MGTVSIIEGFCRLCAEESADVIKIFDRDNKERNLQALFRKYLRVMVTAGDGLPQCVCGPCMAKTDEVLEFVDKCQSSQKKLKALFKDANAVSREDDRIYEIISDVQVEIEEHEMETVGDNLSDPDYVPQTTRKNRRKPLTPLKVISTNTTLDEGSPAKAVRSSPRKSSCKERVSKTKEQLVVTLKKAGLNGNQICKKTKLSKASVDRILATLDTKGNMLEGSDAATGDEEDKTDATINPDGNAKESMLEESVILVHDGILKNEDIVKMEGNERLKEKKDGAISKLAGKGQKLKPIVRCSICKNSYTRIEKLKLHAAKEHQFLKLRYLCPWCPMQFAKISALGDHRRKKHRQNLHRCTQCQKVYPAIYFFTRHMLVHSNKRPFSCDECDKTFKTKSELVHHKRVHLPTEERYTYCCEICGKRFTQRANLESHLRVHTGARPFSCEFCDKSFSQKANMEGHRRTHTGEKPYMCDLCDKSFTRQGQLTLHRKSHTGEKPHKCQFCGKEFLRRQCLRKHEDMHTDTRPYKCSFCSKGFRDQGKRKIHERLHTGDRPFRCPVCGRGFCESGNLRKHQRVHDARPSDTVVESFEVMKTGQEESLQFHQEVQSQTCVLQDKIPLSSLQNVPYNLSTSVYNLGASHHSSRESHLQDALMRPTLQLHEGGLTEAPQSSTITTNSPEASATASASQALAGKNSTPSLLSSHQEYIHSSSAPSHQSTHSTLKQQSHSTQSQMLCLQSLQERQLSSSLTSSVEQIVEARSVLGNSHSSLRWPMYDP